MSYRVNDRAVSWVPPDEIEPQALEQIRLTSQLPGIHQYVAVMPDCHYGKGATVGTVIPTVDILVPSAIGVDIGCGVMAVRTQLTVRDMPTDLSGLRENIEGRIPLSVGGANAKLSTSVRRRIAKLEKEAERRVRFYDQMADWRHQLGSLGSGNHFIEVVLDSQDRVWAFLHSGSRGVGNRVAGHHIRVAQQYCEVNNLDLPHPDLAYLQEGTAEFDWYWADMLWCQGYAWENRSEMMDRVLLALREAVLGKRGDIQREEEVHCHHNYSEVEHHFGRQVYVSRKGAIAAHHERLGLIPGSMGTASYVVAGRGCEEAFRSSPHGAGRRMSRGQARRSFTLQDFDRQVQGVEVRRDEGFLDELPAAYKDIDRVMEQSQELVRVVETFRQIVNVKGAGAPRPRQPSQDSAGQRLGHKAV